MNTRMATYNGEVGQSDVYAHPLTGEAVDLCYAEDVELAKFLEGLDADKAAVQEAKRIVSEEVLRRMDRLARWTLLAQGYELIGRSPAPSEAFGDHQRIEFEDGTQLRNELMALVATSVIDHEVVDEALPVVKIVKARSGALKNLRKLGGQVAEVIDRHAREVHRPRYVSVKRGFPTA